MAIAKCLIVLTVVAGCGGSTGSSSSATADSLAATKISGQTVKETVTEDARATDFLSPDAVKLGVIDAAHVIGSPTTFTVYQYNDTAAAETAMGAWRAEVEDGTIGNVPFVQPASLEGTPTDLDGIADDAIVINVGNAHYVIARSGAFVVRAIGDQTSSIGAIKTIIEGM